jgi:uncharacterized protein (TIGR00645 family)
MEKFIERGLFASRWLLAPFYIGLVGALAMLLVTFVQELLHFFANIMGMGANDAILAALALIDISLAANLLIIVIFSSYENFVSKMDVGDHEDAPGWKGKVDFTGLKIKLIASIVAISGIHLLKTFMDIKKYTESEVYWMVVIHVVFVVSGVMLALMDHLVVRSKAVGTEK